LYRNHLVLGNLLSEQKHFDAQEISHAQIGGEVLESNPTVVPEVADHFDPKN
jgi:hypothetical protein